MPLQPLPLFHNHLFPSNSARASGHAKSQSIPRRESRIARWFGKKRPRGRRRLLQHHFNLDHPSERKPDRSKGFADVEDIALMPSTLYVVFFGSAEVVRSVPALLEY
jgi:hypothetical protein